MGEVERRYALRKHEIIRADAILRGHIVAYLRLLLFADRRYSCASDPYRPSDRSKIMTALVLPELEKSSRYLSSVMDMDSVGLETAPSV